jgi:hypothetical protein
MKFRRIFTGSLTALLFCATSWASACDLSCGFESLLSNCHLSQPEARDSMPGGIKMDAAMEGMSMAPMGDGGAEDQQSLSVASPGMVGHAAIDAMGPCGRQSCGLEITAAAGATHHPPSPSSVSLEFAGTTKLVSGLQSLFRSPQNENFAFGTHERSPLSISLRV